MGDGDHLLAQIDKEMKKVMVAFEEWDGTVEEARGSKKLVCYTEILSYDL